ncbi:MAG: EF-hand domain-containing protein [Planctomycetota bacterium]|jgi:hypothetical protein
MLNKIGAGALALVLSFGCAEAFAQGAPGGPGGNGGTPPDASQIADKIITKLDKDGDNEIDVAGELTGPRAQKLAPADADGNGKITKDELIAFVDANKDKFGKHGKRGKRGRKGKGGKKGGGNKGPIQNGGQGGGDCPDGGGCDKNKDQASS